MLWWGTRRCARQREVAVGGQSRTISRLSLTPWASTSTDRDLPLYPQPLLTSFPRSRAGFPWCSVSEGAQLFSTCRGWCISWFLVQLSIAAPSESLSVSDFNLAGWTLEATCWSDSQVTCSQTKGRGTHMGSR